MIGTRKVRRALTLSLLFCLCFLVPVLLVSLSYRRQSGEKGASENAIVASIPIAKDGKFLKIDHNDALSPTGNSDYLLLFWINLKRLPEVGGRLVLLSKYKGSPPKIQGFAVALKRDEAAIRPSVFFGDGRAKSSKWYDFPEINLVANEWNMFALHLHKGRFMGLYQARTTVGRLGSIAFLGGHELDLSEGLNTGDAELLFGASPGREIRGKLGPLVIVNPLKVKANDLQAVLKQYSRHPENLELLGDRSEVQLAVMDGRDDSSENKLPVETTY